MSEPPPIPVFLLHGFAGARAAWDETIRCLSSRVRPEALALAGHEAPARLGASFEGEVERLAEEVARHLARRGGAAGVIVGYSLGGRLALGIALRHPGLLRRAVLIGASPGLEDERARERRRARDEEWARLLEREGLSGFLEAWEEQPLFASQRRLPEERRALQRWVREGLEAAELARAMRALSLGVMPSYWRDLGRLELPVDLVVGEHDVKFTALAEEMAARLPSATLHVVPGAGHNVVLEAPQAVGRIVESAVSPRREGNESRGSAPSPREESA